ncbi:MAG: hypothetical protein JWM21_2707 [Acidobacteria bacterium]|nr:hypothetical protein [Acidobacteriota bacterium]
MSLQAFQRALVDLTLAPRQTRRLICGDLTILEPYDLDERELRRLLDVVQQPGMSLNCTIARGNRFDAIGEIFPMTCVLLEPVLRDLLDELWESHRPTNYQFAGEEEAFAGIVRRKLESGEVSIPYLDEIFAYECLCWELAQHMRNQAETDIEVSAIIEFQHPPDLLLPPLSELTAPPPGLPEGVYRSRLTLRGTRFHVETLSGEEADPAI